MREAHWKNQQRKMATPGGVPRSRDGIPQWDGDSTTFQDFEEQALQWEQSIPYHKRYLCGPKIVGELTGVARKHVMGKKPNWLSYDGGVEHLMQHLRSCLGRPTIAEMSEFLNKYFRHSKRKRFETMNSYITRKQEVYHRARQALSRVQKHYDRKHRVQPPQWQNRSSWNWWHTSWSGNQWYSWPEEGSQGRDEYHDAEEGGDAQEQEQEAQSEHHTARSERHTSHGMSSSYDPDEDEPWKLLTEELLPEFLQGWYLLADAGLEPAEKNLIQTAIQDDFSVERVAKELRQQWPDHDLKGRDQHAKYSNFWNDEAYGVDEDEDLGQEATAWNAEDYTEEGQVLYGEAEQEAREAFALIQQGRRTLREARARQHQVRLNRQYYKNNFQKPFTPSGKGGPSSRGPPVTGQHGAGHSCLRCGKGHKTSECPDRNVPKELRGETHVAEEAPFVCFTEDAALSVLESCSMTTQEAVTKGYGVIDGGATKTLGSVVALQNVMEINHQKYGNEKIQQVDVTNTPTFGFGNSSQDTCVSTAMLQVSADKKPGCLQIHALDKGQGPILISVSTLRSLKAVIDFEADLMVLRGLDDTKVIPLERSAAGHQLLPLTEDLFKNALTCKRQVPSLRDFC